MSEIAAIFLGIIQGLTEFLPISSSGHLVAFQHLMGFSEPEILLDISLHLGTLTAVIIYFRRDLSEMTSAVRRKDFKSDHTSLLFWIIVGSIPTAVIGLVFKTTLERLFSSVHFVGFMLIITGLIIGATRLVPPDYGSRKTLGILYALAIGTVQGLAIIPGISRSGATIACALFLGLDRELAGRFSFLLSIPAIIGALALQFEMEAVSRVGLSALVTGFFTSALIGFFALNILMGMVKKGHLSYFAPYCWAAGLALIAFT